MIRHGQTHGVVVELPDDGLLPPAWISLVADDGTIVIDAGDGPVLADVARPTPGGPIVVTPRNTNEEHTMSSNGRAGMSGDPSQTYIRGAGYQDAPTDRPPTRASDSIGRRQKYGESGLKDDGGNGLPDFLQ